MDGKIFKLSRQCTLQIKEPNEEGKLSWAPHVWRQHDEVEIHWLREFFSCLLGFLPQPSNFHSPAWAGAEILSGCTDSAVKGLGKMALWASPFSDVDHNI